MNENPFNTPDAVLEKKAEVEIPTEILSKIKNAWIAGIVSISITVVFTLISMSGDEILGLGPSAFLDVILMSIFTFGIYKKSRVCAILMWLLFVANKVIFWFEAGAASGIPLAIVFLWFYSLGVIGTFQYHKFIKSQDA